MFWNVRKHCLWETIHITSKHVLEICRHLAVLSRKYYLEGPGTGKCGQMLQKFAGIPVKARRREYLKIYYLFLRKHSTGVNRSIWIIQAITENSIQMVSALDLTTSGWPLCRLPAISAGYNCSNTYMLLAGWEVRIGKSCDRGLENAARGRRPEVTVFPYADRP